MKKFEFEILINLDVLPLQEPKKPNFGTLSVGRSVGRSVCLSVARPTAYTVHPILTKFGMYNLRPATKIGFFHFFDSSKIKNIQHEFQCCGVEGPQDYNTVSVS